MPVYKYKSKGKGCKYCREGFEIQQSIKDKPLTKCPRCNAEIERVISSINILSRRWAKPPSDRELKEHGFTSGEELIKRR